MRRMGLVFAALALSAGVAGCRTDDCTKDGPSLDIEVDAGPIESQIATLEFDVDLGANHFKRLYPVGDALASGHATLHVVLGALGAQPDEMTVTVRGFGSTDGSGDPVAETTQRQPINPGDCNHIVVSLFKERMVCGATCSIPCGGAASCLVDCNQDSRCAVDCQGATTCDVACAPGSRCSVDCRGSHACNLVRCDGDARCALQCDDGDAQCMFASCGGSEISCGGGLFMCNTACP
jgi:hypothetical protein